MLCCFLLVFGGGEDMKRDGPLLESMFSDFLIYGGGGTPKSSKRLEGDHVQYILAFYMSMKHPYCLKPHSCSGYSTQCVTSASSIRSGHVLQLLEDLSTSGATRPSQAARR